MSEFDQAASEWASRGLRLASQDESEPPCLPNSQSALETQAPNIPALEALGHAKLVVKPASKPQELTRSDAAYADFHKTFSDAKPIKGRGETIMGKKVAADDAKRIKAKAVKVLSEQFSIYEVARILKDPRLALDAYFSTLLDIRDNSVNPKDRMVAADKILTTILQILRANASDESLPQVLGQSDVDTTRSLVQLMVNVNQDGIQTSKPVPLREPPLPLLTGPGEPNASSFSSNDTESEGSSADLPGQVPNLRGDSGDLGVEV